MSKEEIEKIVFHPHMIRIFFYLVLPILSVQTFLTYEYSGLVPDRMSAGPLLGKFMDIASEARNIILANNRYLIDMLGLPEMLDRTPLKIRTPQGPLILFNYEGLFLLQIIAVPTMVCGFISSIIILSIKAFREKIYKWNPREEEKNLHIAKGIFIILFIFSLLIVTQYFIFSLPPYSYVQNLIISGAALYTAAIVNVLFPFVRIKVI